MRAGDTFFRPVLVYNAIRPYWFKNTFICCDFNTYDVQIKRKNELRKQILFREDICPNLDGLLLDTIL